MTFGHVRSETVHFTCDLSRILWTNYKKCKRSIC